MIRSVIFAVFTLSLFLLPVTAQEQTCTNSTLVGAYGFQEEGHHVGGGVDFRVVGKLTFDGKGKASGTFTIAYSNFTVSEGSLVLSYNVQSDCRVTWRDVTFGDVGGETYAGVIVDNGRQILYIETTGDPTRSGQAVKIKVKDQNTQ